MYIGVSLAWFYATVVGAVSLWPLIYNNNYGYVIIIDNYKINIISLRTVIHSSSTDGTQFFKVPNSYRFRNYQLSKEKAGVKTNRRSSPSRPCILYNFLYNYLLFHACAQYHTCTLYFCCCTFFNWWKCVCTIRHEQWCQWTRIVYYNTCIYIYMVVKVQIYTII